MNLYPVTIIEDFYVTPDKVRNYALQQEYTFCRDRENLEYVYPGSRTKDLFDLDAKLHEKICKKLISVFHNTEHDYMRWALSTNFQSVTRAFGSGVLHTDQNAIFAGVLYLSPDAPLNSGTSLYKPNETFEKDQYESALSINDKRFRDGEIVMNADYHSMFDEIIRVNNVYNTLIIYEGSQFHSANQFYGNALTDSRLTQVFFINKIDAQKQNVFPLSRTKLIDV